MIGTATSTKNHWSLSGLLSNATQCLLRALISIIDETLCCPDDAADNYMASQEQQKRNGNFTGNAGVQGAADVITVVVLVVVLVVVVVVVVVVEVIACALRMDNISVI